MKEKIGVAIIGSGNIGTDLMIKILRLSKSLELKVLVGIDPDSDGLARAKRMGVATTSDGLDGLVRMREFEDVMLVFDATSAGAHASHNKILQEHQKLVVDLTPAAIGPYVIPSVNLNSESKANNLNMVTCGGQATIPIVAAISQVSKVYYAEIVASIASKSAGPGTRANIDEFTETTANALSKVGGAEHGKAIIILNPAEPPMKMRDTVLTLSKETDKEKVTQSVHAMVELVQEYVPGYQLKQDIQFEVIGSDKPITIPGVGKFSGLKTTVFLEIEGAAHYLPSYAGNLDIMTSAAMRTAEHFAAMRIEREVSHA